MNLCEAGSGLLSTVSGERLPSDKTEIIETIRDGMTKVFVSGGLLAR